MGSQRVGQDWETKHNIKTKYSFATGSNDLLSKRHKQKVFHLLQDSTSYYIRRQF